MFNTQQQILPSEEHTSYSTTSYYTQWAFSVYIAALKENAYVGAFCTELVCSGLSLESNGPLNEYCIYDTDCRMEPLYRSTYTKIKLLSFTSLYLIGERYMHTFPLKLSHCSLSIQSIPLGSRKHSRKPKFCIQNAFSQGRKQVY